MALEEEVMQHRMLLEKLQILIGAVSSKGLVDPENHKKVEDILTTLIVENYGK